jgi:thymidylate synthase
VPAIRVLQTETIGEAWLIASDQILTSGLDARYDAVATKELANLLLVVAAPDPDDPAIADLGDAEWSEWMRRNFAEPDPVAELGNTASYASRLYDHDRTGRDQIAWVIERLRADPQSRSATITTFEPGTDTAYVPCISLLDFWRPDAEGPLELVVYAHSLDFGKKAYGNLVELARLQHRVAKAVGAAVGRLVLHAKSAHLYEPEWEVMRGLVAATERRVSEAAT